MANSSSFSALREKDVQRATKAIADHFYDGVEDVVPKELVTLAQDASAYTALIDVADAAEAIYAREVPEKGYTIITTSGYVALLEALDRLRQRTL